ncbi:hypothetical protein U3516DRAFT_794237 [Neocallimastix sp. 'constans']
MDNVISLYHHTEYNNLVESNNCYYLIFKNCHFENIKYIGNIGNGNIEFNNCTFKNIIGSEDFYSSIIYSICYGNSVKLLNSIIEDNDIQFNQPYFYLYDTSLESSNSVILNSRYSLITISNTDFKYITSLKSELFNEESSYSFFNVTFSDIITNSKSLIRISNNSCEIENSQFHNIMGSGESSLIIFNSNDSKKNNFTINNSHFTKCKFNSDFIIINGDESSFDISNSIFENIASYGPLINNISLKSETYMNNIKIRDISNLNKKKYGIVTLCNNNNANLIINDSTFVNNTSKNYGGFFHSKFIKNSSKVFGGAIYSDLFGMQTLNMVNTEFINNFAYIGGTIYINHIKGKPTIEKSLRNQNIKYINNTSESYGDIYATKPDRIILNNMKSDEIIIKSGEIYPLEFLLLDEFNQIVIDDSRYYTEIYLEINKISDEKNEDNIKINGNDCIFTRGKCILNSFTVYSTNKLSVVLFASVDNKYHDVNIDGYQFKMNITDCDESQFKKFDKNNKYFYCENPKCSDECPVALEKAICVKGNKNTINSNSCTCLPGWIGENFFFVGILICSIGNNFNTISNYINCVFYFVIKHYGNLLIYSVFLICLYSGYKLGLNYKEIERLNIHMFKNSIKVSIDDDDNDNLYNRRKSFPLTEIKLKELERELNNIEFLNNNRTQQSLSIKSKNSEKNNIKILKKNISYIHNLYIELIFLFVIWNIIITLIILYNNKKPNSYIKDINSKWLYKCPLDHANGVMDLIEIFMIIYLIKLVFNTWDYVYVFKCLKFIGYSIIIWISFGPFIDFINLFLISNNYLVFNLFTINISQINYLLMIILIVWDKVYYISTNKGNDAKYYFRSVNSDECLIHKSYICECVKSKNETCVVEKYINLYKYCSKIFMLSNGKIVYISKNSKNPMKFTIS